jgi:hypothetical protein
MEKDPSIERHIHPKRPNILFLKRPTGRTHFCCDQVLIVSRIGISWPTYY